MKLLVILIGLATFYHVKQPEFGNINKLLSYTQECMKKWLKSGFTIDAITWKLINIQGSKFDDFFLNQ